MIPATARNQWLHATALAVLALAVGMVAITSQSFWMDEGSAAFKAIIPDFKTWWFMTFRLGGSDVQMPFYMIALWGWHKLGPTSEYALRCINLPFLVLMVLALRRVPWWPLVCLSSPFVLYYVGELRPYTMQMAGGTLAALGIARMIDGSKTGDNFQGLKTLAGSALLLTASSLTAAVWAAGLPIAILFIRPDWLRKTGFWLRVFPWILPAAALTAYYLYTVTHGYRAAGVGGSGLLSIGFGFYEMLGLLGIGPSRNALRENPAFLIPQLVWLLPAAAALIIAWCIGVFGWVSRNEKRIWLGTALAVALPLLLLSVIGIVADFRVLGRHLSPAIPALLLPIAHCISLGLKNFRRPAFALGAVAILVFLTSSLFLRFDPKHARDDYRTASTLAMEAMARGKRILWQADMNATRYYAFKQAGLGAVNAIQELETNPPSQIMADLVVINRPDHRFKGIDYQADLRKADFVPFKTFTGFEVWKNRYSYD